ncbi:MAG TPA: hypothetical protein DEA44_16835 [Firmicutes bacterium]|nr:hypothetical protein [Bacillota bacterium]
MDKKYYWLKLKKDFFKRHDIQIIEAMPNGKDYVLLYLKLLVESVDHEGGLRFSDTIPYSDQMIATITNTNIDIVRSAMKVFVELQLIEILDDRTIYMAEIEKMLGSETKWAVKKRTQRTKGDNVPALSPPCPPDVRQEIEIEKEIEIEIDKKTYDHTQARFDMFWSAYPKKVAKQNAVKAFKKIKPDEALFEKIIQALERQKQSKAWTKDGGQFIPHAATWLNGHRWEDETEPAEEGKDYDGSWD